MTLIAKSITAHMGKKQVLKGIDLAAEPGKVTAIVGPNGSGKSTLLKAISGETKHAGTLSLNGRAVEDYATWELASLRGVLQQSVFVAFPFTVIELVGLGQASGLSAADPTVAMKALTKVGLQGFENRNYHDLSGGEQQRVQLARVLAQVWQYGVDDDPRWLFLDEPVSSLDIGHQFVVMDIMQEFAHNGGGVVCVMHDLNLTAMIADQVVLLKSGQVLKSGSVEDVLTDGVLIEAYDCYIRVNTTPPSHSTFVLPQSVRH